MKMKVVLQSRILLFIGALGCLSPIYSDQSSQEAQVVHEVGVENIATDLNLELIAGFFPCKTEMGKAFLIEALKHPVTLCSKETTIMRRQHLIRLLVENPSLKHEVEQLLLVAAEAERDVAELMSDLFKGKHCPELKSLELLQQQNSFLYPLVKLFNVDARYRMGLTAFNLFAWGMVGRIVKEYAAVTYQLATAGFHKPAAQIGLVTSYYGLLMSFQTYMLCKDYFNAKEKRDKIHGLNRLIACSEKIEALAAQNNFAIDGALSLITDEQVVQLLAELRHARYENKKEWFFVFPLVHTFLYRLYQQDKMLKGLFVSIAEMDACHAIATKMLEQRAAENKVCFSHLLEQEQSCIKAHGFWNVLVNNPVVNDFTETSNVILSGPNAGGKTTALKALLQNIILTQSFGVAAASSFEVTPFDIIHSYLRVSDDLVQGLSLFASEVKRAQAIISTAQSLQPGKKYFFVLDELFTGTAAEDGEVCAYEFVKRLATMPGVQFMYATHFERLKELGGGAQQGLVNYKINAPIKDAAGILNYPFTLTKGASAARVGLDIARQAHLFA